jgi:hypothetical protein
MKWGQINRRGTNGRRLAFVCLVLSVALQAVFGLIALAKGGTSAMHHYGEDSTEVVATEAAFDVVFTNKQTGQKITMHIPRVGVRETADRALTLKDAKSLANKIAHMLRTALS